MIFEICSKIPLLCRNQRCFSGVAFDGRRYYMTTKFNNEIRVFCKNFVSVEFIKTSGLYKALYFDRVEQCFWAGAQNCGGRLFRLNSCFQRTDVIGIYAGCKCSGVITNISCCCEKELLLVSTTNEILLVEKRTGSAKILYKDESVSLLKGIFCDESYLLFISIVKSKAVLHLIGCDGENIVTESLPESCVPEAILFYPYQDCCENYHLYLLICECGSSPYLLDVRLGEEWSEIFCNYKEECCEACMDTTLSIVDGGLIE